jgi:hypothetical protein
MRLSLAGFSFISFLGALKASLRRKGFCNALHLVATHASRVRCVLLLSSWRFLLLMSLLSLHFLLCPCQHIFCDFLFCFSFLLPT